MFNVQILQQDDGSSTLFRRFQEKKCFAGTRIQTFRLMSSCRGDQHYFPYRDLYISDQSLSPFVASTLG